MNVSHPLGPRGRVVDALAVRAAGMSREERDAAFQVAEQEIHIAALIFDPALAIDDGTGRAIARLRPYLERDVRRFLAEAVGQPVEPDHVARVVDAVFAAAVAVLLREPPADDDTTHSADVYRTLLAPFTESGRVRGID